MSDYLSQLLSQYQPNKRLKRAFISFDYDHDEDSKNALNAQSKNPDSPFYFEDWSVKEPFPQSAWRSEVRAKIKQCDFVIVLIGKQTYSASGVVTEIKIANDERMPSFGIYGKDIPFYQNGRWLVNIPQGLGNRHFYWSWPDINSAINNLNNYLLPLSNQYG